MTQDLNRLLRRIPGVDRLLNEPALAALAGEIPQPLRREAAQETIEALRRRLRAGAETTVDPPAALAREAAARARRKHRPSLRPVLNASGTLLHTNLGRAPLSAAALAAVASVAQGYSNLELDLATGERGHRDSHVEELLCRLTGAEAATAVNNNAGAVLLALAAFARGREVVVSRGELVEIGGSFRVPDVMAAGGARLREIGTTNKTHLSDFRAAIGPETGLLLKVHTSNYRILGFTASVPSTELVALGRAHGLPVMEDLGSGMLIDLSPFGLPREPTVAEAVASGLDLVSFSGDKLLGGPQAGLIVGRRAAIETLRRHPLARALRLDKLTLAALEATLRAYLDPERAIRELPLLRMLALPAPRLKRRSQSLARRLRATLGERAALRVVVEDSAVGGGALPLSPLPGFAVALVPRDLSVARLAERLRAGEPAVIARIHEESLILNPRTLAPGEEPLLVKALDAALA